MEIKEFIDNLANQFDETNMNFFNSETRFRELEEWSSLIALNILMMIDETYGIALPPDEMRKTNTIQELFDLVQSKL